MNRTWPIIFFISLLSLNCSKQIEQKLDFIPDTIDGVTFFSFNDHSMEDRFSGDWGAPNSGTDRKFFRKLEKGDGGISFNAIRPEKYIFSPIFASGSDEIEFKLNGNKLFMKGQNKFIKKTLIKKGLNHIKFNSSPGLRFWEAVLFPSRISRIRNFKDLIRDQRILFLPGTLRYFIKPLKDESLFLTIDLNGSDKIETEVEIITESGSTKRKVSFPHLKEVQIPLISI